MKRKGCIGCLIGCGTLVFIFIAVSVSFGVWVNKKTELKTESTILSPDTEYFVRLYMKPEDKILAEFVGRQLTELDERNLKNQDMPDFLINWQQQRDKNKISKLLPLEVEVSGRLSEERTDVSAGISSHANWLRLGYFVMKMSMDDKGNLLNHEGYEFIRLQGGHNDKAAGYLFMDSGYTYFSTHEDGMRAMLDGINAETQPTSGENHLAGLDLSAPVHGFFVGPATKLDWARFVASDIDPATGEWRDAEEAGVNIDDLRQKLAFFHDADRVGFDLRASESNKLSGKILLDMPNAGPELQAEVEAGFAAVAEQRNGKFQYELAPQDNGYRVDFSILTSEPSDPAPQ